MAETQMTLKLEDNPHVKELLDILKKHNTPGAEDLKSMIMKTAKIEEQLAAAIAEMTAMRRELEAIREDNHPMRKVLQNTITAMQERIDAMREQLEAMKASIIEGGKNALAVFSERGTAALNGIAKFFKVKPMLEEIAKISAQGVKDNTKTIEKIERISKEYHKAGKHIKNIGRAIVGKEMIKSAKPVGKVAKAVEAPIKAARSCNLSIRDAARSAVKSLNRLEQAASRPKPIKDQIGAAAKQAAAHNARYVSDKERPTKAAEI